jgi:hypothetical protein
LPQAAVWFLVSPTSGLLELGTPWKYYVVEVQMLCHPRVEEIQALQQFPPLTVKMTVCLPIFD